MNLKIKLFFCFIILNSQAFTIDQKLIPILFYQNSSKGGDWVYENRQLHIFGAGIQAYTITKTGISVPDSYNLDF